MILNDNLVLLTRNKRRLERRLCMCKFAYVVSLVAISVAVTCVISKTKWWKKTSSQLIKNVEKTADAVKEKVSAGAEVMNDIKDGYCDVAHDFHKTAENIAKDL